MWEKLETYFQRDRSRTMVSISSSSWEIFSDRSFAHVWKYICLFYLFFQWGNYSIKNYLFVHITTAPKSSVLLLILPSAAYYNYNTEYKVISFTKTIANECKTRHNWWIGKDRKVQGNNVAILDTEIGSSLSTESS